MSVKFKEEQRFTQWWLWLLLTGIAALPVYGIYKQLILGEKFGDKPMPDAGLIIFAVFVFALIGLFWNMQLKTEIDETGIRISFFPFVKKRIAWRDIKSVKVVNYGFVGGWGIRLGTPYGTVYNTRGNIGLAIELKNGKNLCIGTQKAQEINTLKGLADGSYLTK
jgi:hypothetical protein